MPTTHPRTQCRTGGSHLTLAAAVVLPWLAWSAVRAEPLLPADCPPSNHGCLELGDPGCSDVACCKIVCGFDAFCCAVSWDEPCVDAAGVLCEVADPCAASDHGCLTVGGPGCTDIACCESVCAIDPLCCEVAWTMICVGQAEQLCKGTPAAPELIFNVTPAAWLGDPVAWVRDMPPHDTVAPGNGVDFLIDGSAEPAVDIVVNLRGCIDADILAFLQGASPTGTIQRIGRYITYVTMSGVTKEEAQAIARHPSVAFVERQVGFQTQLNVSVPSMKVAASGSYSPNTVQDALPAINGAGINIAIIDTGVDNVQHLAFAGVPLIGYYDATTQMSVDPDDDNKHGTHVAAIALGRPFAGGFRGVAPGAGLIDVKVLDASGSGTWTDVIDGIETVYDNRSLWNAKVMNLSLGSSAPANGLEAICQLLDLADSMGICVVVAAGNSGPFNPGIGVPAAASRALTIAASNDLGTIVRSDDGMGSFSSQGPRASNGNATMIDELKPEVAAPGVAISAAAFNSTSGLTSLSGTSMAAPHVAGLVALMMQAQPDLNCATIRCRLIATAEQLPANPPSLPLIDPLWNKASGWGIVDGFKAVVGTTGPDVRFPSHPANPGWLSPDITTVPFPPKVGVPNSVFATILNPSGSPIPGVLVQFGIHDYSASIPTFHDIGSLIVTLAPGLNVVQLSNWIPASKGHQCAKVCIGYCDDPDASNNCANRNLTVTQSPVQFQVRNTLTHEPQQIEFDVELAKNAGWTVQLTPATLVLGGDDCPVDVVALPIPPFGLPDGATTTINIGARIGNTVLGGVTILATMRDCNGNGEDDYFDILTGRSVDQDGDGVPDECECSGDLNGDRLVDGADIGLLLSEWGQPGDSDITGDGVVDGADLGVLLSRWGACS